MYKCNYATMQSSMSNDILVSDNDAKYFINLSTVLTDASKDKETEMTQQLNSVKQWINVLEKRENKLVQALRWLFIAIISQILHM